jgi:7-carboxy-7-deazaguanine synthase
VRFGGCPLRCSYCDTPRSWKGRREGELHLQSSSETFANPLDCAALELLLQRLAQAHGAKLADLVLAVTGGEPLEQLEFLRAWLPQAPAPVLLETAGIRSEALAAVLPWLRFVSLDAKDPVDLRSGAELNEFAACLAETAKEAAARPASQPLDFWTKFIVTENTTSAWLQSQLAAVAAQVPGGRVYLQPVTPRAAAPLPPHPDILLQQVLLSAPLGLDLRVLPQIHPLLEIR